MDSLIKEIDKDHVEYKGKKFRFHENYFVGSGGKYLHRMVYRDNFGEIPPRFIVHHKDGDTRNNSPGNLVLMTRKEHGVIHNKGKKLSEQTKAKITGRPKKEDGPYDNLPFPPAF